MSAKWICSLAVLTLACGMSVRAEEASVPTEEKAGPLAKVARRAQRRGSVPIDSEKKEVVQQAAEEEKNLTARAQEPRKKLKAHFAGSKRPPQNAPDYVPEPKVKKSNHIKNEWVSSKTHPKTTAEEPKDTKKAVQSLQRKTSFGEGNALKSSRRFQPDQLLAEANSDAKLLIKKEMELTEGVEYPRSGFIAPAGHVYIMGEWLYWCTREGGLEYAVERSAATPGVFTDAVPKKLDMDWQSGFRVGGGFHLPVDGWDISLNYTDFKPEASSHASGSIFPLLVYQGQFPVANVTEAHGHWKISFQTLDVELGRACYIGRSLIIRPSMGMRGAWIDQHFHFDYRGGDIPAGQEYTVRNKNEFKGVGVRAGINSNLSFGLGLSLNCDLFGSLVIGRFDLSQHQQQIGGVEVIDMDTDLKQFSPNAQLFLGLSWDHNFYRNRCHFGMTFGFESQYWWGQNQVEHFTDAALPIYVRPEEDLAFYGINLRARLDF